jgi:hypothetical protein
MEDAMGVRLLVGSVLLAAGLLLISLEANYTLIGPIAENTGYFKPMRDSALVDHRIRDSALAKKLNSLTSDTQHLVPTIADG